MRIAAFRSGRRVFSLAAAMAILATTTAAAAGPSETADSLQQLLANKDIVAAIDPSAAASAPALAPTPDARPGADGTPDLLHRAHDRAAEAVLAALNYLGVRYRRGGNSAETGFDCSGFTRYVFETSLGLILPRQAEAQAKAPGLLAVKREDLRPGDLVFFKTMRQTFSHVGIYIGDHRFIHAPSRGKDVRTDDMSFAYWAKRFTGGRRAELPAQPQASPLELSIH